MAEPPPSRHTEALCLAVQEWRADWHRGRRLAAGRRGVVEGAVDEAGRDGARVRTAPARMRGGTGPAEPGASRPDRRPTVALPLKD